MISYYPWLEWYHDCWPILELLKQKLHSTKQTLRKIKNRSALEGKNISELKICDKANLSKADGAELDFMDARLIENATDPVSNLLKDRGTYVLTPKGLHVLERFITKNGINSDPSRRRPRRQYRAA